MPASSANLGPGFDSLAVALAIYLWVRIEPDSDPGPHGSELDLLGGEDLIALGMQRIADEFGRPLPGCRISAGSDIPVARGLGSSAAAIVAGLQAGAMLLGSEPLGVEALITIGGEIEGHADNVSAAVLGGLTAAIGIDDGFLAAQIVADFPWAPVLFVPDEAAFTHQARGILPPNVPLADASANIGRTALLVKALRDADATLIGHAMDDRLHQPYRARLFPHLEPVIRDARRDGAVGACLSGAGPTVLALVPQEAVPAVCRAMTQAARGAGIPGDVRTAEVDRRGVIVRCGDGASL